MNRRPLNQTAKRWLREAGLWADPELPYVVQLLWEGFQANLAIPGQGGRYWTDLEGAAAQLLDHSLDAVKVMRWLITNPNGPPRHKEQSDTLLTLLEESQNWEEAAQNLMEWFYDRKAAQDPYYR